MSKKANKDDKLPQKVFNSSDSDDEDFEVNSNEL